MSEQELEDVVLLYDDLGQTPVIWDEEGCVARNTGLHHVYQSREGEVACYLHVSDHAEYLLLLWVLLVDG